MAQRRAGERDWRATCGSWLHSNLSTTAQELKGRHPVIPTDKNPAIGLQLLNVRWKETCTGCAVLGLQCKSRAERRRSGRCLVCQRSALYSMKLLDASLQIWEAVAVVKDKEGWAESLHIQRQKHSPSVFNFVRFPDDDEALLQAIIGCLGGHARKTYDSESLLPNTR